MSTPRTTQVHQLTEEHTELAERALQNIGPLRDEHAKMRP